MEYGDDCFAYVDGNERLYRYLNADGSLDLVALEGAIDQCVRDVTECNDAGIKAGKKGALKKLMKARKDKKESGPVRRPTRYIREGHSGNLLITEALCFREARIDESARVIRNVSVLGPESLNRRRYTEKARKDVVRLGEGARVYLDHPQGDSLDRDIMRRAGTLVKLRMESNGVVYGDLELRGAASDAAMRIAKETSNECGMSILAEGFSEPIKDEPNWESVEEVRRVYSVDMVDRPGAVKNLFENTVADRMPFDPQTLYLQRALQVAMDLCCSAAWKSGDYKSRMADVSEAIGDLIDLLGLKVKREAAAVSGDRPTDDTGAGVAGSLKAETHDMDLKSLTVADLAERKDLLAEIRKPLEERVAALEADNAKLKVEAEKLAKHTEGVARVRKALADAGVTSADDALIESLIPIPADSLKLVVERIGKPSAPPATSAEKVMVESTVPAGLTPEDFSKAFGL